MVSGGGLAEGREIPLGALVFVADDSAWLQEAPLDFEALPVRGATHFRVCVRGVLLRQPSTQYRSVRESWIRGCSASRTILSAGLQDYEDTRWKTSSRVRKVLSLAWKAS